MRSITVGRSGGQAADGAGACPCPIMLMVPLTGRTFRSLDSSRFSHPTTSGPPADEQLTRVPSSSGSSTIIAYCLFVPKKKTATPRAKSAAPHSVTMRAGTDAGIRIRPRPVAHTGR